MIGKTQRNKSTLNLASRECSFLCLGWQKVFMQKSLQKWPGSLCNDNCGLRIRILLEAKQFYNVLLRILNRVYYRNIYMVAKALNLMKS